MKTTSSIIRSAIHSSSSEAETMQDDRLLASWVYRANYCCVTAAVTATVQWHVDFLIRHYANFFPSQFQLACAASVRWVVAYSLLKYEVTLFTNKHPENAARTVMSTAIFSIA